MRTSKRGTGRGPGGGGWAPSLQIFDQTSLHPFQPCQSNPYPVTPLPTPHAPCLCHGRPRAKPAVDLGQVTHKVRRHRAGALGGFRNLGVGVGWRAVELLTLASVNVRAKDWHPAAQIHPRKPHKPCSRGPCHQGMHLNRHAPSQTEAGCQTDSYLRLVHHHTPPLELIQGRHVLALLQDPAAKLGVV
jgi:hypothetical protein